MTLDHLKMKVRRLVALGLYGAGCICLLALDNVDGSAAIHWISFAVVAAALLHALFTKWNE